MSNIVVTRLSWEWYVIDTKIRYRLRMNDGIMYFVIYNVKTNEFEGSPQPVLHSLILTQPEIRHKSQYC